LFHHLQEAKLSLGQSIVLPHSTLGGARDVIGHMTIYHFLLVVLSTYL